VYLHEYISIVADIFEAPPNEISSPPSEILQKECTHIETSTNYLTEMSRYVNNNTKPNMNFKWMLSTVMVLPVVTVKLLRIVQ